MDTYSLCCYSWYFTNVHILQILICMVSECSLRHVWLFVTPQNVDHKASLSRWFPRQGCWNGLPFSTPWGLPDPRIKFAFPALAGRFFTNKPSGKPQVACKRNLFLTTLEAGILRSGRGLSSKLQTSFCIPHMAEVLRSSLSFFHKNTNLNRTLPSWFRHFFKNFTS